MTLPALRRLHRWVALVVGLQLVLWCVSGATFAWLDHESVAGSRAVQPRAPPALPADVAFAEPARWADPPPPGLREIRLQPLLDRWTYRVATADGTALHDALDGRRLVPDETLIRRLAAAHYAGVGAIAAVEHHEAATLETRDHGAAWAVRYDDAEATTLWFDAADGRLLEVRTDAWRVFDVLWMLHTMDYAGRDDFNHPLVVLFASGALWVALTGLLLVVRVFRRTHTDTGAAVS